MHTHKTALIVRRESMAPKKTIEKTGKKPLSGYMKFTQEARPRIKKANPSMTFGELGKAMGAEWRAMTDAAKAKFK